MITLRSVRERLRGAGRPFGLTVFAAIGLAIFVGVSTHYYPIKEWLFVRYAGYWLACFYWGAGCLSAGHFVTRRLSPTPLPLRDHLAVAFAVGVVVYYFVTSVAGLFYLYKSWYFWLAPLLLFAVGARDLVRTLRRARRHLRAARTRSRAAPWWVLPIVVFGLLGLGMVYFLILTPENVQFDSRWKHFALAEQYAVTGGVRRFPEGWTVETNPHLATYVYLYGFLLPFGQLFDRVELAAHLEFFVFAASVFSISSLARRLVPGSRIRHAWAARFLFPGVFLYDSSVSGGADHIAAVFVVPMFLVLLKSMRDLSWKNLALFGALVAGAVMVKLTCLLMFVPVAALALIIKAIIVLVKPRRPGERTRVIVGVLASLGTALLVTSTFWAKNWWWYGDPIYPSLYKVLTLRPWTEDAPDLFVWAYQDYQFWRPDRNWEGIKKTLIALVTFSFDPNDYPRYHGNVPVFGSLFTLLLAVPLFFKKMGRMWLLVGSVHAAILVWYWVHHQDRYLQPLVPWMAAYVAAALVLMWRTGIVTRIAGGALVAYQIAWGGDVYFIATHAMVGSPVKASVDLLSSGYRKDPNRFKTYSKWVELGKKFPKGARVLLHDNHVHLGIAASTVSDWNAWQYGMSYGRRPSPGETYDLLREMEVTHLAWESRSQGWDTIAGDIVFYDFALNATDDRATAGGFELGTMPKARPTLAPVQKVLFLGCNRLVKDGLYDLGDLHVPIFGPKRSKYGAPRETGSAADLALRADAVVTEGGSCKGALPQNVAASFQVAAKRKALVDFGYAKEITIYLRKKGDRTPSAAPAAPAAGDELDPGG